MNRVIQGNHGNRPINDHTLKHDDRLVIATEKWLI
jgi:hypothetical protein